MPAGTGYSDDAVRRVLQQLAGDAATGQLLEPRRVHPFAARMPLAVAEHLVENLTPPGAVVLDPMVGSGTTVIAAKRLGRQGVGFDRDPLAVLIARISAQSIARDAADLLCRRILERARAQWKAPAGRVAWQRQKLPDEDAAFIGYWFPPASQKQLFALADAIRAERGATDRDLAWVTFSTLIIAKSAGASYALDISRSRPHKCEGKAVIRPFDVWERRFKSVMKCLPFVDQVATGCVDVRVGDARELPLDDGSVDLVLTSPPYRDAIDYLRSHKFSLVWMRHRIFDLRELRGTMIGSERGLTTLDGLPPEVECKLNRRIQATGERARVRRYLSDLRKTLAEIGRVLRPDGLAVLVLGPTMINAVRTDASATVSLMAERYGLHRVAHILRNLSTLRRSLPPPSQAGADSPLHKRMRREVLIAFRKQV